MNIFHFNNKKLYEYANLSDLLKKIVLIFLLFLVIFISWRNHKHKQPLHHEQNNVQKNSKGLERKDKISIETRKLILRKIIEMEEERAGKKILHMREKYLK